MSEVLFEKEGGVALLTLNRPERLNAISVSMLAQLSERLIECDRDRDVPGDLPIDARRIFVAARRANAGIELQVDPGIDDADHARVGAGCRIERGRRGRRDAGMKWAHLAREHPLREAAVAGP